MDSIPKFLASVVTIVIGVLLCVSLIISAVVVNSARTYHSSVIEQIEASNFDDVTIEKCIAAAASDNYLLSIEKTTPPDSEPGIIYKVVLKYGFSAPIFGKVHTGELVGYALAGARIDTTGAHIVPGLYETGALALYYEGKYDEFAEKLITPWSELVSEGYLEVNDGAASCKMIPGEGYVPPLPTDESVAALVGDLLFPFDGSITATGEYSFTGCEGLTGIYLPDSLKTIGMQSFDACSNMTDVYLGEGLESAGVYAFAYCGVKNVTYNGTLLDWYNIDFSATSSTPLGDDNSIPTNLYFKGVPVESVVLPSDLTSINANLSGCSNLRSLLIPDGTSLTTIPSGAFWQCVDSYADPLTDGLNAVYIGEGVTTIQAGAFGACYALKTVYISSTVTSIDNEAFSYCDSLNYIVVDDANTAYKDVNEQLIIESASNKLVYTIATLKELDIPKGVIIIGEKACYDKDTLTSVSIPSTVTQIERSAFNSCGSLKTVDLQDISVGANDLTTIGAYAFSGCNYLESIVIPDSVTSIGDNAFYNCSRLKKIYFTGTQEQWNAITKGTNWNRGANSYSIVYNYAG